MGVWVKKSIEYEIDEDNSLSNHRPKGGGLVSEIGVSFVSLACVCACCSCILVWGKTVRPSVRPWSNSSQTVRPISTKLGT